MSHKFFYLLFCLMLIPFLTGCKTEETYTLQAVFSNETVEEVTLTAKQNSLEFVLPLKDFTCDVSSIETSLERKQNIFVVILKGQETQNRCAQKLFGKIEGILAGQYQLQVIYDRLGQKQNLLKKDFNLTE